MKQSEYAFLQQQCDNLDEINATLAVLSDEIVDPKRRATLRKAIYRNLKVARFLKAVLYDKVDELDA